MNKTEAAKEMHALPELSNLVKVEIWNLQRRNRESTIEQFVFVEVRLFFSECSVAKRAWNTIGFYGFPL